MKDKEEVKEPLPPAYRATRADKEKDKKEGFVESKGAVAVKDGGIGGRIRRRRRIRIRGEGEKGRRGEGEKEGQEEGEKEKDEWNVGQKKIIIRIDKNKTKDMNRKRIRIDRMFE